MHSWQVTYPTLPDLTLIGGYSVFLASYVLFALGKFPGTKIDRPGAAIIGAVLMFAFGAVDPADALQFVHFGTLTGLAKPRLLNSVPRKSETIFQQTECGPEVSSSTHPVYLVTCPSDGCEASS
jgi:hypothetical protein